VRKIENINKDKEKGQFKMAEIKKNYEY